MDVDISDKLINEFVTEIQSNKGKKQFGYFLSDKPYGSPVEYMIFQKDKREDFSFTDFGEYYVDNDNAGFLTDPIETYKFEKYINDNGLYVVGVFHCHLRHPAIFAKIDQRFHPSKSLWHLIISVKNPDFPQISVYHYEDEKIVENTILL